MTKHATVLQKSLPGVDLFAGRMPALPPVNQLMGRHPHNELAIRLFGGATRRTVVTFTSVHPGEGITSTIVSLAAELVRSGNRVAILDGELRHLPGNSVGMQQSEFLDHEPTPGVPRAAELDKGEAFIGGLRTRYDCILIDCGALANSVDLLRLAPLSDGVVLIVEAEKTNRQEVERAIQFVRDAQGRLLGFVLNKRRYPIPSWLYRRL